MTTHQHPGHPDSHPGYMDVHWHEDGVQHGRSSGDPEASWPASAHVGSPWEMHRHADDVCPVCLGIGTIASVGPCPECNPDGEG